MSATGKLKGYQVVLLGGLVAGTLDIIAACLSSWLQNGVSPPRVFRYIASGVLGPSALTAGAGTAALGLFLHYVIATGWTLLFYLISRKLKVLVNQAIPSGLAYGVLVYVLMNFIVVPLSSVPARRVGPPLSARALQVAILMFCIGLPIALVVRKFAK